VAPVAEHLPGKHKALSSDSSPTKKKRGGGPVVSCHMLHGGGALKTLHEQKLSQSQKEIVVLK
jgi:hypothetical protein